MRLCSVVQIFAKYPQRGAVKTRLASGLGCSEQAMEVHCELVERQLAELMRLPRSFQLELWCTEDADAPFYRALFRRWPRLRYRRQNGADLGQRLDAALASGMRHASRVLQIGTDCPVLQCTGIHAASDTLSGGRDTVFIPAEDGGYVLGGYGVYRKGMFDHIEWSSSRVMSQVQQRLRELGIGTTLLPALWDIDHLADLQRYRLLQAQSA